MIDQTALKRRFAPSQLVRNIVILPFADSTNRRLKEDDYPPGTLVFTLDQRAGRGRLGREWSAPAGSCLAMSVSVPSELLSAEHRPLLPHCAAIGVSGALRSLCSADVGIKWPNDIICSGRKICGILCEHTFRGNDEITVCGMGINLNQTAQELERMGLPYAGSLAMLCGSVPSVEDLLLSVCGGLEEALAQLASGGFERLRPSYEARCVTLGKQVLIVTEQGERTGFARAVAPDGGLVIERDGELETVYAGEVSVRGLYGYLA